MIFTKIHAKNLYCFENTELDLTYPRKIVDSLIDYEYLDERAPNFRFKRLCIISGANASGKSSFGKVILHAVNIITHGRLYAEKESFPLSDDTKAGELTVEFVYPTESELLFRQLTLYIHNGIYHFKYAHCPIAKADSVEVCRGKIATILNRGSSWGKNVYLEN
ncbi:MAG TPA: hypothetical protein H9889_04980, partial [Candidatus Ignatzschineria merdigallinarum]|nr:hypothetical protein [Candidatus Ignatzschineria merdigallinarum]